jgi:WhiB family redox-sensing transcriptional regulator
VVVEDGGLQAWLDQAACRDLDPERFFPESGEQTKAAEAKAICAGCQVRDQCLELAVHAAGGLDHDHGVFGGTLPAERSRLRGNRFPEPSAYRQRRELAEQAHQLASQVGLRQAARQLGIHRDALKAAFQQWQLAMPERRVGWQPSRFLTDRAEAERAFALAEQLGSVNAAATELGTTWPSLRKAFTRHGLGMPARNPQACASARSTPSASAPGSRARRALTRCLWRSTRAPSRPGHGRRMSCTSGSVATRSTPSWGPTWWSSCTAKATPASPPPGLGRSSDGPSAATGWPTNAPAAPSGVTPTEPTILAGPSNPRNGRGRPMLADPHRPDQPDSEPRFRACCLA